MLPHYIATNKETNKLTNKLIRNLRRSSPVAGLAAGVLVTNLRPGQRGPVTKAGRWVNFTHSRAAPGQPARGRAPKTAFARYESGDKTPSGTGTETATAQNDPQAAQTAPSCPCPVFCLDRLATAFLASQRGRFPFSERSGADSNLLFWTTSRGSRPP